MLTRRNAFTQDQLKALSEDVGRKTMYPTNQESAFAELARLDKYNNLVESYQQLKEAAEREASARNFESASYY